MNHFDQRHEKEIRAKSSAPNLVSPQVKELLNMTRLPGSVNVAQTAAILGFQPHDIPILAARGFLTPLGNPTPNCEKFFARVRIVELAENEEWLSQTRAALYQHWRMKNARNYKPRILANQH